MNIFGKKQILHHFKILFPLPIEKIQNCLKKIQFLNLKTTSALCISFNGHAESPETAQLFYQSLINVKQTNKLQTYAFIQNQATSLTYFAASSARQIIANPYSLIGDVGTTQKNYRNIKKLLQVIGVRYVSFGTKNQSSQLWNQFLQKTEKQKQITSKWLDVVSNNLVKSISQKRKIELQNIQSIKNKVFHPKQALNLKLIDQISTFEQFIEVNYPNHQIQSFVYKLDGTRLKNLSQRQISALNTLIDVIEMPKVALLSSEDLLHQSLRDIIGLVEERLSSDESLEELQAISQYILAKLQTNVEKAELIF